MKRYLLVPVFLLVMIGSAFAALTFPALTGHVVDEAHILSDTSKQQLDQMIADYETASSNQIVVVTLPSLQGVSIGDYGYQLGRKWGIGQKGKNNGVLLIVAPNQRIVRIEVGYGLEGTLTDALCSQIIQGTILPDFRIGDMQGGVVEGAADIIQALGGNYRSHAIASTIPRTNILSLSLKDWFWITIFIVMMIGKFIALCSPTFYRNHPLLSTVLLLSGSSRSSGSSGSFGGGFSGGGGSFGGGGASGGW